MRGWRGYVVLLVLAAIVFVGSFAIGRAVRSEPAPRRGEPPPRVEALSPQLVHLGPLAKLPALRPAVRPRPRPRPPAANQP